MTHKALAVALALGTQAAQLQAQSSAPSDAATGRRTPSNTRPTIVLVHGGFVDGSGWEGVYQILREDGYNVAVLQHPTISLAGDVAVTRSVIAEQTGPVLLVGHSYGGVVITEAGNDPKVVGLVYIAAFAPDNGESVASLFNPSTTPIALIKNAPPDAPKPPFLPPRDGFLYLDRTKFSAAFAADVESKQASFMAESQVPWGLDALNGAVSTASWRNKPSWYLVATDDRMIPPDAQRFMAGRAGSVVVEAPGSHALYVSRPAPVAALIEKAATASAPTAAAK
jgi:pimeloyl-ACP methyl ester carboxylesterase